MDRTFVYETKLAPVGCLPCHVAKYMYMMFILKISLKLLGQSKLKFTYSSLIKWEHNLI